MTEFSFWVNYLFNNIMEIALCNQDLMATAIQKVQLRLKANSTGAFPR